MTAFRGSSCKHGCPGCPTARSSWPLPSEPQPWQSMQTKITFEGTDPSLPETPAIQERQARKISLVGWCNTVWCTTFSASLQRRTLLYIYFKIKQTRETPWIKGTSTYSARFVVAHLLPSLCILSARRGKINMEPKNHAIEKENHLPNHHFQVPC